MYHVYDNKIGFFLLVYFLCLNFSSGQTKPMDKDLATIKGIILFSSFYLELEEEADRIPQEVYLLPITVLDTSKTIVQTIKSIKNTDIQVFEVPFSLLKLGIRELDQIIRTIQFENIPSGQSEFQSYGFSAFYGALHWDYKFQLEVADRMESYFANSPLLNDELEIVVDSIPIKLEYTSFAKYRILTGFSVHSKDGKVDTYLSNMDGIFKN